MAPFRVRPGIPMLADSLILRAPAIVVAGEAFAAVTISSTCCPRRATAAVPAPVTFPGEFFADDVRILTVALAVRVTLFTAALTVRQDLFHATPGQETADADGGSRLEKPPPPGAARAQLDD
jgi:hypothetical protein